MVKSKKISLNYFVVTIIFVILVFFSPFLLKPQNLTTKDNDLGRTYIPIFNFIKKSIKNERTIPLWRPDQMMGEPFIGNPIYPIIYPLNILYLIMPVNIAAVIFYLLHYAVAGISTFYLAKSFSLKNSSSFAAALLYAFSTNIILHTAAGHISMVAAFSIFPLIFLCVRKILQGNGFYWIVTNGICLSFTLALYPTIFYYVILFLFFYVMFFIFTSSKKITKSFVQILPSVILTLMIATGLSAIYLFPQIEFGPLSTRSQLKLEDVAIPLWNLKKFLISLLFPYLDFKNVNNDTFIYLGMVPTVLGLFGYLSLSRLNKTVIFFFGLLTILFVAGMSSFVFPLAYDLLPYLKYSRVTTRPWFIISLIAALLAAQFLNKLKNKTIIFTLILLFLAESIYIGYSKISDTDYLIMKNINLYEYLANDQDIFRVYCTTYCFNPQLISKYDLNVLHGETPIQYSNLVSFLREAGNYTHNQFSVIFPPYQSWQIQNPPQPNPIQLGEANVKYIASTYPLISNDFIFLKKYGEIHLYKNNKFKPRIYFEDGGFVDSIKYTSNLIHTAFKPKISDRKLIFSENYYPGWEATFNKIHRQVSPEDKIFRSVIVPANATELDLKYSPASFKLGTAVTLSTIIFLVIYNFKYKKGTKL